MNNLKQYNNEVKRLEDFDFDGTTLIPSKNNPNDTYIVKLSAAWCHFCKDVKEPYKQACSTLSPSDNIIVCNIEVDDDDSNIRPSEKQLANEVKSKKIYNMRGFPTILRFKNGVCVEELNGGRDVKSLIEFFHK